MLITIGSWIYLFIICFSIGAGVYRLLGGLLSIKATSVIQKLITGIIAITVYVEFFSIFYKIGMICHLLMLFVAMLCLYVCRKEILQQLQSFRNRPQKYLFWRILFYLCFTLLVAFFTSRGTFHTDTGIYHAQMIRIYEEYGVIKGWAICSFILGTIVPIWPLLRYFP